MDSEGNVGSHASLALAATPPYTPHIAYADWTQNSLRHAWRTSTGWLSETVDSSGGTGMGTSLALVPTLPFTPHVSYFAAGTGVEDLRHSWRTASGWVTETVDSEGQTGWNSSLVLAPSPPYTVHISYTDFDGNSLNHARRTASGWVIRVVDGSGAAGNTSLALVPTSPYTPHISYEDTTNTALNHAWLVRGYGTYLPLILRNG